MWHTTYIRGRREARLGGGGGGVSERDPRFPGCDKRPRRVVRQSRAVQQTVNIDGGGGGGVGADLVSGASKRSHE